MLMLLIINTIIIYKQVKEKPSQLKKHLLTYLKYFPNDDGKHVKLTSFLREHEAEIFAIILINNYDVQMKVVVKWLSIQTYDTVIKLKLLDHGTTLDNVLQLKSKSKYDIAIW
ncbi:hypothetical protein CEXT_404251 [Caerostris extrusa]|uniref:Uncharacterized protein n=1 Tax=Caerostris extrusa TaxID=172846 RepID=A0AAV4PX47_CAEEX|nr:hypothetical protein CEXT_404251 [Caerostris extrusa]